MLRRRPLLPMRSFHRAYQIQINSLKRGEVISHKGKLWVITSFSHHAQGRGGSHYKVDLRDMKTGAKGHERFNTGSILEGVELQEKKLDFLYISENVVHAIDPDTFEEFNFPIEILEGFRG